jgi:hypothetical protein
MNTESYTISEPASIGASVTVTDAISAGATDGTATAVVSPSSNYTYEWNNGAQTTQTATGFGAGTATVTVTQNGTGCSQTVSGVVVDPASCNITVTISGTSELCNGASDGVLATAVSGGPSTIYSYSWSNLMTNSSISGLAGGTYSLVVSSGSCTATDVVTIADITGPEAGTSSGFNVCQSDLTADLFDGIANYTDSSGSWSGVFFGSTIFPIAGGADTSDYTYTVDDGNGSACSVDSVVVTVIVYDTPNAGGNTAASACVSATTLNLAPELASPDAGGVWLDIDVTGALTDSIFDVSAVTIGDYDVAYAVAGNPGCTADTAFITVQIVSTPSAGASGALDACDDQFTLDPVVGLGGTPDAGGTWTDVDGSGAFFFGNFTPALAGAGDWDLTYTVTAAGCPDDSATVTVTVYAAPDAGSGGADTVCVTVASVDVSSLIGGTPDAGGTWSDDNSSGALTGSVFDPSSAGAGVYNFSYTVAGTSPCVDASASVEMTVSLCSGIENVNKVYEANIFPNPNQGDFYLQLKGWDIANTSISITSIDGRELYNQYVLSADELIKWNNAVAGIYFVTIKEKDQVMVKQLVIEE